MIRAVLNSFMAHFLLTAPDRQGYNGAFLVKLRHKIMPKRVSESELEVVLQAVGQFPNGGSVAGIRGALGVDLPRRTLQRRLAQLVEAERLEAFGAGPARRYRVRISYAAPKAVSPVVRETVPYDVLIPLSAEAGEIQSWVQQPIQARQPVGYNPDFLAAYQPNRSFYLDESLRFRLREMGKSRDETRPPGVYVKKLYGRLLTNLAWNSSRLEGNTYSLLETDRLLRTGQSAEGKDARETQMILNHKAAFDLLVDAPDKIAFNRHTVCNLHTQLAHNLLPNPSACGRLRAIPVYLSGSVYMPLANPVRLDHAFQSLLDKADAIQDPFEQAFFVMVHLPYLQPFEDVNKRVSRLAANVPFIQMNLAPLSFMDVPEKIYITGLLGIYELNRLDLLRDLFVWAYERSCRHFSAMRQVLGEPDVFRMRYREMISELIPEVVRLRSDKGRAATRVKVFAMSRVPLVDRQRFIEVVEIELLSLHEGNFAGYRVRLEEFRDWQRCW